LNLISKSDPFAEDAGRARADEGFANGSDAGTETDPNKVHAGDMYAAGLKQFFGDRLQIPSVISDGEVRRLCAVYRIAIGRNMRLFHVKPEAVRKSGNDLFDDAARSMLQKLLDDGTALPEPPPEVEELYRGRTADISITGPHGDASRCR
jgi:hypothetical protein